MSLPVPAEREHETVDPQADWRHWHSHLLLDPSIQDPDHLSKCLHKSCFSSRRLSHIDLPREIIDSAKSLVIGKAESARLKEATDGADQKIEAILNQVRSLEQKLELVLAALKIKH